MAPTVGVSEGEAMTKAELEKEIELLRDVLSNFDIEAFSGPPVLWGVVYNGPLGRCYANSTDPTSRLWVQRYGRT